MSCDTQTLILEIADNIQIIVLAIIAYFVGRKALKKAREELVSRPSERSVP